MGIFDSLFGGGSNNNTQTSIQTPTVDPFIKKEGQENYEIGKALTSQSYQPFTGNRTADFSADKTGAFDLIRKSTGSFKPYLDAATSMTGTASAGVTPEMLQRHMNPYTQEVIDRSADEILRSSGIINRGNTQKAVNTGNYGGSRHGVVEAENNRNTLRAIADMTAATTSKAYESALSAGQTDLARMIQAAQAMAGFGNINQAGQLRDAAAVGSIGSEVEAKDQRGLDIAYQDYMRQYAYPFDMLKYRQDLLAGNATPPTQTTVSPAAQGPSVAGQVIGLGLTLPQLLQAFGSGG